MQNIDRIKRMEEALDACTAAVKNLSEAVNAYADVQKQYQELTDYYFGPGWPRDLDADRDGLLPRDLKRGVLSEDAVYDLVTDNDALISMLHELLSTLENKKTAPDEV